MIQSFDMDSNWGKLGNAIQTYQKVGNQLLIAFEEAKKHNNEFNLSISMVNFMMQDANKRFDQLCTMSPEERKNCTYGEVDNIKLKTAVLNHWHSDLHQTTL